MATENEHLDNPEIRVTDTHIYFLGGILSNWYSSPEPFYGKRALELCLPELDALKIPHPPQDAVSTYLIQCFPFRHGEQWMMALKAWLFERGDSPLGESIITDDNPEALASLQNGMVKATAAPSDPQRRALWESVLCQIMRTNSPRSQKALGRKVPNFNEGVWTKASGCVVAAGCAARAEADEDLKGLYLASGERVFVEGSSRDRVWGVGLDWKSQAILDEGKWKGGNRLGRCHGEAARLIREKQE